MKDSKQEAMEKHRQGKEYFEKSNFRAAIIKFSEGKLLLPLLDMYAEEIKQFCWWLAECHLRNVQAGEVSSILSQQRRQGNNLCIAKWSMSAGVKAWLNACNMSTQHSWAQQCCNMLDDVGSNLKTVKFFSAAFSILYSFGLYFKQVESWLWCASISVLTSKCGRN